MERQFLFQFQPIQNREAALDQLAEAVEYRVECYSRERLPALWRWTDRQSNRPRAPRRLSTRRKAFRTIMAVIYYLLGMILFTPGLMLFEESPYLLLFGTDAIIISVLFLSQLCRPLAVGLNVAAGIFALLLAHGGIENAVDFTLAGIFFLLLSAILLFRGRNRKGRFREEAKKILRSRESLLTEVAFACRFSEAEMTLLAGENEAYLPYSSLHAVWETKDLLLLEFDNQGARTFFLQKSELSEGTISELALFLIAKGISFRQIPH